jgi:sialic acid synthase SpsE
MENYSHLIKNIALRSNKNKIAVIGKGDSIKDIDLSKLNDFFIININDTEKFIHGDVALFHRIDLYDKLRENGFRAEHYIAPSFFKIPDNKHIEVKHVSGNQEGFEHTFEYLEDPNFYLVDFIILSAIKLAIDYQKVVNDTIDVYFLGFDFHSENVKPDDNQMYDLEYKNVILKTQESFFKALLDNFGQSYPSVNLVHVGEKVYSGMSVNIFGKLLSDLSSKVHKNFERSNSELYSALVDDARNTGKVIVVAEFTNNHIGDPRRIVKMIELAKEAGADIVKLQKRDVDTFYTADDLAKPYKSPFGNTLGDYRRGVELNKELFDLVDSECRKNEIPWFTSVLDWNSYEFMLQFDTPLIKLPSTISNHKNYLLKVGADFRGDLVISTGFTEASYEKFVLDNFMTNRNLFLLQCTSSYPTPPEACQVSVVRHYEELSVNRFPNLFSGYSSHDVGSLGCMLAVAAGAKMLEKHVKLGDLDWIHFDGVAVDLYNNKFKDFVHDVRKAELMCGGKQKVIHQQEHHKYAVNDKSN